MVNIITYLLIAFVVTLFPNKVIFWNSRDQNVTLLKGPIKPIAVLVHYGKAK